MRREQLAVAVSIAAFLTISLAWVSLPGPEYDELLFVNAALPRSAVTWYVGSVQLFGTEIPTMLMPYLGALKGLVWRAIFAVLPPSIYVARIPAVILAALSLLLFYLWARKFYGGLTAVVALALAATDPSYIFTARFDLTVVFQHLLRWCGMLLAATWLLANRRSNAVLMAAGICFGLGIWDKATFLWFLVSAAVGLATLFPRETLRQAKPAQLAVFAAGLLIGSAPFIIYNLTDAAGGTFQTGGIAKLDRATLLWKLGYCAQTLNGTFMLNWQLNWPETPAWGTLFPWALAAAVAVLFFSRGLDRRAITFPVLLSVVMWIQMMATAGAGTAAHHHVLAYPLPHLAVAAAAHWVWSRATRLRRVVVGAALAVVVISHLAVDARYLTRYRQTGGIGIWSDAIYDITTYLKQRGARRVVNMDWGFSTQLLLLGGGRIPQEDFFFGVGAGDAKEQERQIERVVAWLNEPDTLFLFHADRFTVMRGPRRIFDQALKRTNRLAVVDREFRQRDGEVMAVALTTPRRAPGP